MAFLLFYSCRPSFPPYVPTRNMEKTHNLISSFSLNPLPLTFILLQLAYLPCGCFARSCFLCSSLVVVDKWCCSGRNTCTWVLETVTSYSLIVKSQVGKPPVVALLLAGHGVLLGFCEFDAIQLFVYLAAHVGFRSALVLNLEYTEVEWKACSYLLGHGDGED